MISHVMERKMRLSKLLFIAMVALCLVFMRATADAGDEVAVEGEGEAVAPGAQGVEGGAEVGESQVAQDVVRSQVATTRGPTRSQTPSKAGKGSKLKIAIVIGMILLLLAVAAVGVGFFVVKPMMKKKSEEDIFNKMKDGMPTGIKMEKKKMGDDKKEQIYATRDGTLSEKEEADRAAAYEKMSKLSMAKKTDAGVLIPIGKEDQIKEFCKGMDKAVPDGCEDINKHLASVFPMIIGGDVVMKMEGKAMLFCTRKPAETKPEEGDKKKK